MRRLLRPLAMAAMAGGVLTAPSPPASAENRDYTFRVDNVSVKYAHSSDGVLGGLLGLRAL